MKNVNIITELGTETSVLYEKSCRIRKKVSLKTGKATVEEKRENESVKEDEAVKSLKMKIKKASWRWRKSWMIKKEEATKEQK